MGPLYPSYYKSLPRREKNQKVLVKTQVRIAFVYQNTGKFSSVY